ncbi:helix-turn-helix transcriptional regulator [Oscillospiraceae bacterium 38-13]
MEVYDFGLRLKKLREARQLSQKEAAARLDVGRSTISGYERNIITPSVDQLVRMAVLYNTSLDYMMGLENRSSFFVDDLEESQQQTVLDVVKRLKQEFLKG